MSFQPSHAIYVKSLYRRLLSESALFFDDRTRLFIQQRTRQGFRDYQHSDQLDRVKYKIREARKSLHRLEKANRGHPKEALKILMESYGRTGKTRHMLLYPYLHHDKQTLLEPFVPHAPRTRPPPVLCPPLAALVVQDLQKPLTPQLPTPEFKPLHPGRKANLLWRHRSMLLDRLQAPLPFEILVELESKAGADPSHPLSCASRVTGGPRWHDLYCLSGVFFDPQSHHLSPQATLPPLKHGIRRQPLMVSPYAYQQPDLVQVKDRDPTRFAYSERHKRRLYQKLLAQVPLITPFHHVWQDIPLTVSRSNWVPQATHRLLPEPLSPEIVETTLSKKSRKK